jgi:hypothetical protein
MSSKLNTTRLTTPTTRTTTTRTDDRGGVPDLSVSGDKSNSAGVDPHDLTTTSEPKAPLQSLNQLHMVTGLEAISA